MFAPIPSVWLLITAFLITSTATFSVEDTKIIDNLLANYSGKVLPYDRNGTHPTIVTVNILVTSITDIDQVKMTFTAQLTFRMEWYDARLKYNESTKDVPRYLSIPPQFGKKLWKPDLHFANEQQHWKHDVFVANEFYRVYANGEILYSTRASIKFTCPMDLRLFPFDKQTCPIEFSSFGHTNEYLILKWHEHAPLQIPSDLTIDYNFNLDDFSTNYCHEATHTGVYSCLRAEFIFGRKSFRYLRDSYAPMVISILLIWTSTWISSSDLGGILARALLLGGATFYCKWSTSKYASLVPYMTTWDMWDTSCTGFIVVAIVEFVLVVVLHSESPGKKNTCRGRIDIAIRLLYPIGFVLFAVTYFAIYAKWEKQEDVEEDDNYLDGD
ncbi:glutamate-gated chloride channel isoform X2 [Folsomia candida]|uniref:glutamate-gated chloride channel isoform X2 n=1 Tax=Folsomia candida TaxID=158441 RepID=UPI001604E85C|nr:glutamate-gated chloride channel isoform X2 [Folsomia candida]